MNGKNGIVYLFSAGIVRMYRERKYADPPNSVRTLLTLLSTRLYQSPTLKGGKKT